MNKEEQTPQEVEHEKWYRVSLVDVDIEEDVFAKEKFGEQKFKLHYVFGTVARFADGKRRFIKYCRGSNWVSNPGKEGLKFPGSINQKVWDAFGIKKQVQEAFGGYAILNEEDREELKQLFNSKVALCQVKVVEKGGKRYANYLDIKPMPDGADTKDTSLKLVRTSKPRPEKTPVPSKAPY